MNIENFDLRIENHIKKLCEIADKSFPKRNWFIAITCWSDRDFRIVLNSGWGKYNDTFTYRKSDNEYNYQKIRHKGIGGWDIIKEKILEVK